MIFLNILIILMLAGMISLHSKQRIELSIPFSVCYIILFFYFFAILGVMGNVVYLLLLASMGAYAFYLRRTKKFSSDFKTLLFTPGLAVFLCFAVFMWWFNKDMVPTQWDEFSHWALSAKEMFYSNRLSTSAAAVTNFKSYPPAPTIWQYFFLHLHNTYDEGVLFYAHNLFPVCMALPITCHLNRKQIGGTIGAILLIFLSPYLFYAPYDAIPWGNIYVDRTISYLFVYTLLVYCILKQNNKKLAAYHIAAGLAVLSLTKAIAVYFCAVILLVIAADTFVSLPKGSVKTRLKAALGYMLPIAGFTLLVFIAWRLHLTAMSAESKWDAGNINLSAITALLNGTAEQWKYTFISVYYYFLFESPTFIPGKLVFSCLKQPLLWLVPAAFIALSDRRPHRFRRHLTMWFFISLCFAGYLVGICLIYLLFMSEAEAAIMSSCHRYVASYWQGALLFYLFYAYDSGISSKKKFLQHTLPVCVFALVLAMTPMHLVKDDLAMGSARCESYAETNAYALSERDCYPEIRAQLTEADRVYVITNNDYFWHLVSQYEILPFSVNTWDPTDTHILPEALTSKLINGGYTYLWLHSASEAFTDNCAELFNGAATAQTLYKVTATDGHVTLQACN